MPPRASSAGAPSGCARSPTGSGAPAARRASGSATRVLVERVDADGRLHGYGADYTAYELRAQRGAGVGDLVEVVLEAAGERAALGRVAVIDRIDKDVKTAMKSGDAARRDALRLVLSSLRDAEKDARAAARRTTRSRPCCGASSSAGARRPRRSSDAGHADRAAAEESEAALIEGYLPAQLPDEDLDAIVESAVAKVGANGPARDGAGHARGDGAGGRPRRRQARAGARARPPRGVTAPTARAAPGVP